MAKKILLVDDSATTRMTNRIMIARKTAHEVVCAADGSEALRLAARERPDLVLMDVMMPGIDGLEVCRRMRKDFGAGLPIVLLTFRIDEASISEGYNSGCTAYLKKPKTENDLLATLNQYLKE